MTAVDIYLTIVKSQMDYTSSVKYHGRGMRIYPIGGFNQLFHLANNSPADHGDGRR